MQIDFHHAVTYVVSRLAGFNHAESEIIAYAAQYVDDATDKNPIIFINHNEKYDRICSAHKLSKYLKMKDVQISRTLLSFHFLPGNDSLEANRRPVENSINRWVCQKNSPLARDMIAETTRTQNLYRLGITLHVFADTWSHRGFVGAKHSWNEIEDAREINNENDLLSKIKDFLRDIFDDIPPPIGHACSGELPDYPFLNWRFSNVLKVPISRPNIDDYCEAIDCMYIAIRRFKNNNMDLHVSGLSESQMEPMKNLLASLTLNDGRKRHRQWLMAIADGRFGFEEHILYKSKRKNSWHYDALGDSVERDERPGVRNKSINYRYRNDFDTSHFRLFYEALKSHQTYVLDTLLPQYELSLDHLNELTSR